MENNISIKVDPEQLARTAGTLKNYHSRMQSALEALEQTAGNMGAAWKGAAADMYSRKARDMQARGETLAAKLEEFYTELQEVSGIYTQHENTAQTRTEGLPTDGVFID